MKVAERSRLQDELRVVFKSERGFGNVCVAAGLALPIALSAMHHSRAVFAGGELLIAAL